MPVIIGVNPVKKPRRKRKGKTMATRKTRSATRKTPRRRRRPAAPKAITRWRTKTVTRWRDRKKRRVARRVSSGPNRMTMRVMLRDGCAIAGGMIMAKVAVNKLTSGGSETERWTWPNIAMAAGSSVTGALILGALFRLKKPTVAFIALGGVALAIYKTFTTKLAPRWTWSEDWFGADEDFVNPELLGDYYGDDDEFEVVDYDPDESMGALPAFMRRGFRRFRRRHPAGRIASFISHRRRRRPPRRRWHRPPPRRGYRPPSPRGYRPPTPHGRRPPPPRGYRPPTPHGRRPPPPRDQRRLPPGRRPYSPNVVPFRRSARMHGDDDDYDMLGYTNTGGQVVPVNPAFGDDYGDDDYDMMGYTNTGGQVVPVNPAFGDDYDYAEQV